MLHTTKNAALASVFALAIGTVTAQRAINNVATNDYQVLKNSYISLLTPKGFAIGKDGRGFEQGESSISVAEIRSSYSESLSNTTEKSLDERSTKLVNKEQVSVNGRAAFITEMVQTSRKKWVYTLNIGNEATTLQLAATAPENASDELKKALRKAIESVVLRSFPVAYSADYRVEAGASGLRLTAAEGNKLSYSLDNDELVITIEKQTANVESPERKEFTAKKWKEAFSNLRAAKNEVEFIKINNCSAGFLQKKDKNKQTSFLAVIYEEEKDKIFILKGIATANFEANETLFKDFGNFIIDK